MASVSRADLEDITALRTVIETEALRRSMAFGDDAWEAGILAAQHRLTQKTLRDPETMREGAPEFDATGRTSMEIGVRVEAENIRTGHRRHTNSCYFTMVAVDDVGRPAEVPPLTPSNPTDRKRHQAAELRRGLRKEFAERLEMVASTGKDIGDANKL